MSSSSSRSSLMSTPTPTCPLQVCSARFGCASSEGAGASSPERPRLSSFQILGERCSLDNCLRPRDRRAKLCRGVTADLGGGYHAGRVGGLWGWG